MSLSIHSFTHSFFQPTIVYSTNISYMFVLFQEHHKHWEQMKRNCLCACFHLKPEVQSLWLYNPLSFSSVQSLSRVRLFATPWIAAHQAFLSITNSRSSLRLTSIESVMPSSHLILCGPLFLLPPIPPSIRVFSNESTIHMRWSKYWSFSFSISTSKEHPGLIFFRMDWLDHHQKFHK